MIWLGEIDRWRRASRDRFAGQQEPREYRGPFGNQLRTHHTADEGMASREQARKKAFKKGVDGDDARRRREETTIQIRKNKREEQLKQRRRMDPSASAASSSAAGASPASHPEPQSPG